MLLASVATFAIGLIVVLAGLYYFYRLTQVGSNIVPVPAQLNAPTYPEKHQNDVLSLIMREADKVTDQYIILPDSPEDIALRRTRQAQESILRGVDDGTVERIMKGGAKEVYKILEETPLEQRFARRRELIYILRFTATCRIGTMLDNAPHVSNKFGTTSKFLGDLK